MYEREQSDTPTGLRQRKYIAHNGCEKASLFRTKLPYHTLL